MKKICKLCKIKLVVSTGNPSQRYCNNCSPSKLGLKKQTGRDYTRRLVRIRDKYTCQDCGYVRKPEHVLKGKKNLDVHHLKGLCGKKTKRYDRVSDMHLLITLCHKCHYHRHDFSKEGKASMHAPRPRKKLRDTVTT